MPGEMAAILSRDIRGCHDKRARDLWRGMAVANWLRGLSVWINYSKIAEILPVGIMPPPPPPPPPRLPPERACPFGKM